MQKIVITHIRNEEYLLPWWLEHHKSKFDHGVVIDYHSTDNSRRIIKEKCPSWEFIRSKNKHLGALDLDREIEEVQEMLWQQYPNAWILVLTVTEFLLGDLSFVDKIEDPTRIFIPCRYMIDPPEQEYCDVTYDLPLHKQRTHGIMEAPYGENPDLRILSLRGNRLLHNYPLQYALGRHYFTHTRGWVNYADNVTDKLGILWYGYSPFNHHILKRLLGVQELLIKEQDWGAEHFAKEADFLKRLKTYQKYTSDISDYINELEP